MTKGLVVILLFACAQTFAQLKNTRAVKVTIAPRVDGLLDDAAWQQAPIATDFITNTPVYGHPATSKTDVRVVYDNTSIYIGVYLHADPGQVRTQFTPRDNLQRSNVDYFSVFLDTYQDRQNAYQFTVTARNVQSDARVSPNYESNDGAYGDLSWDAVWDSRVSMQADGWIVEMRIPLFSIRFARKPEQEWGIQFMRFSRGLNETSFWNPVNPAVSGLANQFGNIGGFEDITPTTRLSFSPYVSAGYRQEPRINEKDHYETLRSGGMDVKYGLNESFTLDATLIPDFGQVVSDNVVNNISPFEIQFRENRPFFTEGTELFNKAGIFYSRRIGRTPDLYDTLNDRSRSGGLGDYWLMKNPSVTRLYNAIKFSGRTAGNLGIGFFNAVTQPARALLRSRLTGADSTVITEPLTNYNIFVLDQALKNRSYITLTNTNVLRNGHERDANVTALDIALYDKANRYGVVMRPRFSAVLDKEGGYNGFSNYVEIGKVSGNLQYSLSNQLETDKYDLNDLGFLGAPNEFTTVGSVSYNIFQATKRFLNQSYEFTVTHEYLYKPFLYQKTKYEFSLFWLFKNFWDVSVNADIAPGWFKDYFDLQTPASLLETPRQPLRRSPYYSLFIDGSSDSRKRLFVNWAIGGAEGPLRNDPYYSLLFGIRYRFSDRLSVEASYNRQYDNGNFGYSFLRDAGTNAPILARRRYADVTSVVSGVYNFTSRMNLTFRARHYWNRLLNTNLYDVLPDGNWTERTDMQPSDHNVNYNAFNLDVFYTWDFRLGSRLIVGWKNWLGTDYGYAIRGDEHRHYTRNAHETFRTPHGNEFTVRFIYFLNYQQFLKK